MNARDPRRLGKYEIVKTLGKGAMGVVYLARDPVIERNVAVKTIRKDLLDAAANAEVTARFRREAMAAGRLTHPSIVAVYDYGEDENVAYIVMEYAPGEDLTGYAAARSLSLPEVGMLMAQLLDALEYAHGAGIVHRDIKPANMLVAERLKITDFGIARIANSSLTQTGATMGTPAYMAPEQYMGVGVDHRVDLFAAGVVCYELLTGLLPFDGSSLEQLAYKICHTQPIPATQVRPSLPQSIDAVLAKALAKTKEGRFASAGQFARVLADALAGRDSSGPMTDPRGTLGIAATVSSRAPAGTWAPETMGALARMLAPTMGSVAGVAVKRAASRATDPDQLVRALTDHIDGDGARAALATQLRAVLGANQRNVNGPSSAPALVQDTSNATPDTIARVTQVLATYVGPIAKVMVKRATTDTATYSDLCFRLSEQLGSEAEKTKFLRELGLPGDRSPIR